MTLAQNAMLYFRDLHKDQKRKYTNQPYFDHLAEVAGIAMSVGWHHAEIHPDKFMAVCWGHDSMEDQGATIDQLFKLFGAEVAGGIKLLSDLEEGNRAARKALSRERLSKAPPWVQTIKLADMISNTGSIVQFDPKFAETYLDEKRDLLRVMTKGHPALYGLAMNSLCRR